MTPASFNEEITAVELTGLSGGDMNGLVKEFKVSNAKRIKKDKEKEVIATRIYDLNVPVIMLPLKLTIINMTVK